MVRPVDARLRVPAPSLVARPGLVLDDLLVFAGEHQVRRLEHRLHAHRGQLVEIDVAYGLVRTDVALLLQHDRPLVETLRGTEYGETRAGVAADDRPVDGRRAAVLRQQRGVVLDRAEARELDQAVGREL